MDVEAIPLGIDFIKALREDLENAMCCYAVIGENWQCTG